MDHMIFFLVTLIFLVTLLFLGIEKLNAVYGSNECIKYEQPCYETSECCFPFFCINKGDGFKCKY